MNSNFKNETFGNVAKATETVHYKGELRIVGQVVNQLTDKDPIGYVIMVEKTQQFKMYTVEQTKALITRFKFVNAALENGKIINTECAMSRMPKFNTQMSVIGNHGIIILGEIVDGGKKVGYRAMDTNAKIVDIEEHEIVKLNSNGVSIINAKIVKRDNSAAPSVSAIKSEFTKIEKSKLADMMPKRISKTQQWRNERHIQKIMSFAASRVLTQMFLKSKVEYVNFSDNWAWRESDDMYGRWVEPFKEYRIFCKEIATEKYNCAISDKDKDILKTINGMPRQDRLNYCQERMSAETKWFMLAFLQIALNNNNVYSRTVKQLKKNRNRIRFDLPKELVERGLACDSFKRLVAEAKEIGKDAKEYRESLTKGTRRILPSDMSKAFKTKTFTTGKEMAQLGFTISEDNRDLRYVTDYGYHKTLLYLGDVIGDGYSKYRAVSRCLGDVAAIAYVEKLLSKLENGETYIGENDMIASMQMIISIAYMFNSEAMKLYVNDSKDVLEYHLGELPVYEEIAGVDYKLNNWLTMYYASGFNVFLNDDDVYQYKHTHIAKSEVLNYRQLGVKHNIKHTMLQDEFASVVSLVTPPTVSGEDVTRLIGQLRFL